MSEQLPLFGPISIGISKGFTTYIDPIDADLMDRKWYILEGKTLYVRRRELIAGRWNTVLMHRVILSRSLGRPLLATEQVDHIDGDGLNNRRANLRLATPLQNARNQKMYKNNTSGYKGVFWSKSRSRWVARIGLNGKRICLGYFKQPEAAYSAYCEAVKEYFGEFARQDDNGVRITRAAAAMRIGQ